MPQKNQQTWIRLTRLELKEFAGAIGQASMAEVRNWPENGEGRAVKSASERINKIIDVNTVGGFSQAVRDLKLCKSIISDIRNNSYFNEKIGPKIFIDRHRAGRVIADLAVHLESVLSEFIAENTISLIEAVNISKETVSKIERIVPDQKFGPVYYRFDRGKLLIDRKRDYSKSGADKIIEQARLKILEDGNELISDLSASNVDLRVGSLVEKVVKDIESKDGIIRTGLSLLTLESYEKISSDEMSDVLRAKVLGFIYSVTHFAGQFREWDMFIENSSNSNFDREDIESAHSVGRAIVESLNQSGLAISPEVPQSIKLIADAIVDWRSGARRAAWATLRAIENLVIVIAKECISSVKSLKKGIDKGVEKGATAFALATALYLTIQASGQITPNAAKIMKADWIESVVKLINAK